MALNRTVCAGLLVFLVAGMLAVPSALAADFGDAPDPTYPSLLGTSSSKLPGRTCPYHLRLTQEWIGTSEESSTTSEMDALVTDGDFDDGLIALDRALVDGKPTGTGYISVPITFSKHADESLRYLNVVADLNRDGKWASYPCGVSGDVQMEWVAENVAVPPSPGKTVRVHVPFFLCDPSVAPPYHGIWVRCTLTTEYIDPRLFLEEGWDGTGPLEGFERGETEDWRVSLSDHTLFPVPSGAEARKPTVPPAPIPKPKRPTTPGPDPTTTSKTSEIPDIPQESGECAPTSAANSLFYLGKSGEFSESLPGDPSNPRPLIEKLKTAMNWVPYDPVTGKGGVYPDYFMQGKQQVTNKLGIPVDTSCTRNVQVNDIIEALDKCNDVEILLNFHVGGGHYGGHYVTVVGYVRHPDGSIQLIIHDPDDGYTGPVYYWVGYRGGVPYLIGFGAQNWISYTCVESLRSTLSLGVEPPPPPPPTIYLECVEITTEVRKAICTCERQDGGDYDCTIEFLFVVNFPGVTENFSVNLYRERGGSARRIYPQLNPGYAPVSYLLYFPSEKLPPCPLVFHFTVDSEGEVTECSETDNTIDVEVCCRKVSKKAEKREPAEKPPLAREREGEPCPWCPP